MQSTQPGAFSNENLIAFEALAGQLAVSVTNAELFAEIEQERATIEAQTQFLTQKGWQDFMDAINRSERIAYTYDRENITPLQTPLQENQTDDSLITPIRIAGVQIGKLQFQKEEAWTDDDYATTITIVQQAAQQIENLRLMAQSQQYQAEAQETLQLMTREGWADYQDQFATQSGFVYQDHEVKPLAEGGNGFENALSVEIKVRNEPIGKLAIAGVEALSDDHSELMDYI